MFVLILDFRIIAIFICSYLEKQARLLSGPDAVVILFSFLFFYYIYLLHKGNKTFTDKDRDRALMEWELFKNSPLVENISLFFTSPSIFFQRLLIFFQRLLKKILNSEYFIKTLLLIKRWFQ